MDRPTAVCQGPGEKHPPNAAISQLLKKIAEDKDWFPGKIGGSGSLGGRPPVLSETNRRIIAAITMAQKAGCSEPTRGERADDRRGCGQMRQAALVRATLCPGAWFVPQGAADTNRRKDSRTD